MQVSWIRSCLLVLIVNAAVAPALHADVLPGLSALSDSVVRESAIAFVNTTISPGLEGATLTIDDGVRESEQVRGSLDDEFGVTGDAGQSVRIGLTRDVLALRGSLGLSFPVNKHFKLRP